MSAVVRCWQTTDAAYNAYHDEEWGRPVRDERGVYERLCLEGFQSGLSWLTILRKRENFRAAFAGFDPGAVARFDERDVERLLSDAGIVRHRGKIEAAIANARATLELRESGTSLHELVWEYRRDGPPATEWVAQTPESVELSKRLRKAGFRFVGPTTVYSTMQACGIVNDHRADCWVRDVVERERSGPAQDAGVLLAQVEEWDPSVPMSAVLSQIDRAEGARADFEAGVVRITVGEYQTALAVAAERATSTR